MVCNGDYVAMMVIDLWPGGRTVSKGMKQQRAKVRPREPRILKRELEARSTGAMKQRSGILRANV